MATEEGRKKYQSRAFLETPAYGDMSSMNGSDTAFHSMDVDIMSAVSGCTGAQHTSPAQSVHANGEISRTSYTAEAEPFCNTPPVAGMEGRGQYLFSKYHLENRPGSPRATASSTKVIKVKKKNGDSVMMKIERNASVEQIKEMIAQVTGTPIKQQKLLFDGKLLQDGRTLHEQTLRGESEAGNCF
jgi:hypothetical protein